MTTAKNMSARFWPRFEVFSRDRRGPNHLHMGSLHAADAESALRRAHDRYTRPGAGLVIWVVAATSITASSAEVRNPLFSPSRSPEMPVPRPHGQQERSADRLPPAALPVSRARGGRESSGPAATRRRRQRRTRRSYEMDPRPAVAERPRVPGRSPLTGLLANDRMAYDIAGSTPHPELPLVTIADLGILREVRLTDSSVTVTITPASGNRLAVSAISADIGLRLRHAGLDRVSVRTQLVPAWSSDWITSEGRRKLAAAKVALPSGTPRRDRPGQALSTATGSRVDALGKPVEVTGG
jgi:phenylacetate-CoA oxygenase PaaJ subunit